MQHPEAGDEVPHRPQHQPQFPATGVRSLEEDVLLGAGRLVREPRLRKREGLHRRHPSVARATATRLLSAEGRHREHRTSRTPHDVLCSRAED